MTKRVWVEIEAPPEGWVVASARIQSPPDTPLKERTYGILAVHHTPPGGISAEAAKVLDAAARQEACGYAWGRDMADHRLEKAYRAACGETNAAVREYRAFLTPPQAAATGRLWTAKDIAEYEQRLSIVKEAFARFEEYDPPPAAPTYEASGGQSRVFIGVKPVAPGRTVKVRVAVAMTGEGTTRLTDILGDDEEAWGHLRLLGYPIRLAILTAELPIPDVPEVRAKVEGV